MKKKSKIFMLVHTDFGCGFMGNKTTTTIKLYATNERLTDKLNE